MGQLQQVDRRVTRWRRDSDRHRRRRQRQAASDSDRDAFVSDCSPVERLVRTAAGRGSVIAVIVTPPPPSLEPATVGRCEK